MWKRDPLAVIGVASVVVALMLWAMPSPSFGIGLSQYSCENGSRGGSAYSLIVAQVISGCLDNRYDRVIGAEGWFTLERLPALVGSLALGVIVFAVRAYRRRRTTRMTRRRAPQTFAVAIVSAAVSALVVTGAGLLLVNQKPSKTVFQTIYSDPTATTFPIIIPSPSPSPTPTPTPKPTKAPLRSLSESEKVALNEIIFNLRAGLDRARISDYECWMQCSRWSREFPFEDPVIKSSYTNTQFIVNYTLTRWIPIDPYNPTN